MSDKASLQRGAFLFCLSHTGNLTIAADFAGTTRAMMMAQMAADEGFAKDVQGALLEAGERVFHQALLRGLKGVAVPRFYQGEIVGYVHSPSDSMLRYALERLAREAAKLDKTADNQGADEGSDDGLAELRQKIKDRLASWVVDRAIDGDRPEGRPEDIAEDIAEDE